MEAGARALLEGEIPPTLKHMIMVRIASDHGCRYCRVLHSDALEAMGVPTEVVDSATTDVSPAELPPVQRAVVEFAVKAAADPKSVSDDDCRTLQSNGLSPLFSPRGEAKCMKGPSVRGARRLARGGVLEQYGEHGEQAQRSNGGPIVCFARQAVRNAG